MWYTNWVWPVLLMSLCCTPPPRHVTRDHMPSGAQGVHDTSGTVCTDTTLPSAAEITLHVCSNAAIYNISILKYFQETILLQVLFYENIYRVLKGWVENDCGHRIREDEVG